jgi:hypothetical protein
MNALLNAARSLQIIPQQDHQKYPPSPEVSTAIYSIQTVVNWGEIRRVHLLGPCFHRLHPSRQLPLFCSPASVGIFPLYPHTLSAMSVSSKEML